MEKGRRHLWLALRVLFNYLEVIGFDINILTRLRKALPSIRCGIDLRIPSEDEILDSMRKLSLAPTKYQALYNLLIDSGLRIIEGVKVINEFKPETVDGINDFYRITLGEFRGSKQAYYCYFTKKTYEILQTKIKPLKFNTATCNYRRREIIVPKYLRKFSFDKMIELEIPESVADFIQGRVPMRIGARHYMNMMRQADKFYGVYAEYITILRSRLRE